MEARQTLRGSGVPKGFVIAVAACAALGMALVGSVVAKNFTGSSSTVNSTVHAAPGTVLRQDNPANAGSPLLDRGAERQAPAPAPIHRNRSTGNLLD
jgi:hypothetical protein